MCAPQRARQERGRGKRARPTTLCALQLANIAHALSGGTSWLGAHSHRENVSTSVDTFGNFRTASPAAREMLATARQVAEFPVPVLIQGETGTGKELVARGLHAHSKRADHPFVAVNCGALSETLAESELFGHARGAFTGANTDRKGLFESADGGTIFLDEVVDLSAQLQVKLLRVLQEGEVRRVGDSVPRKVDVRVIAACAASVPDRVKAGDFREDLYFRLAVMTLKIPPLRRRPEDIVALSEYFLERCRSVMGIDVKGIDNSAMDALLSYRWPGNVRELENAFQRGAILAHGGDLARRTSGSRSNNLSLSCAASRRTKV